MIDAVLKQVESTALLQTDNVERFRLALLKSVDSRIQWMLGPTGRNRKVRGPYWKEVKEFVMGQCG